MKKRILITTLALLILAISNPAAAKMKMGPEGAAYPGVTSDGDDGLNVQGAVSVGSTESPGTLTLNGATLQNSIPSHADATARDAYWDSSMTARTPVDGSCCITGTQYQRYNGASWVNASTAIKGDKGDTGSTGATGLQGAAGSPTGWTVNGPVSITDHSQDVAGSIQNALNNYKDIRVKGGIFPISSPLIVRSDQRLELAPNATIQLTEGSDCNMLQNRAVANSNRDIADVSIVNDLAGTADTQGGTATGGWSTRCQDTGQDFTSSAWDLRRGMSITNTTDGLTCTIKEWGTTYIDVEGSCSFGAGDNYTIGGQDNILYDSSEDFATSGIKVDQWVHNVTDDSWGRVSEVGGKYLVVDFMDGGTDNDFSTGDVYQIAGDIMISATAAFTNADVGRTVLVTGAGAEGDSFSAVIDTVTNGTTVQLSDYARMDVAAANCSIYERDKNITVIGGVWDRQGNDGGLGGDLHTFFIRRADNITLHPYTMIGTTGNSAKYAISAGDITIARIGVDDAMMPSDGVHIQGPASDVHVSGVFGSYGDDIVSLTARDYGSYADVVGDIKNLSIDTIFGNTNAATFKTISGTGTRVSGVSVNGLGGTAGYSAVAIVDDVTGATDVSGVSINKIDVKCSGNALVRLSASQGKDAFIGRCTVPSRTTGSFSGVNLLGDWKSVVVDSLVNLHDPTHFVGVNVNGNVNSLTVRNPTVRLSSPGQVVNVSSTNSVKKLQVISPNIDYSSRSDTNAIRIYGDVDQVLLSGANFSGGRSLFTAITGSTIGPVTLQGCNLDDFTYGLYTNIDLDVMFLGINADASSINGARLLYTSGGNVDVYGAGINFISNVDHYGRAGSEVITSHNPDFIGTP